MNDPTNLYSHPSTNTSHSQFLRPHKCNLPHKLKHGSYVCLIREQQGVGYHDSKLPPHIHTYHVAPVTNQTMAGNFTANEEVKLHNILLPKFHKT